MLPYNRLKLKSCSGLSQQAQTVRRIFSAFLVVLIEFENNDNSNNKTHAHSLWPSYWSVAHNAADQDCAVAPPHCWHHLAYHSVPSGQSGACVPMSVCGPKDSSTVWGGIVAANKAAHWFCMENFNEVPTYTLHPQPWVISMKTS